MAVLCPCRAAHTEASELCQLPRGMLAIRLCALLQRYITTATATERHQISLVFHYFRALAMSEPMDLVREYWAGFKASIRRQLEV